MILYFLHWVSMCYFASHWIGPLFAYSVEFNTLFCLVVLFCCTFSLCLFPAVQVVCLGQITHIVTLEIANDRVNTKNDSRTRQTTFCMFDQLFKDKTCTAINSVEWTRLWLPFKWNIIIHNSKSAGETNYINDVHVHLRVIWRPSQWVTVQSPLMLLIARQNISYQKLHTNLRVR